MPVLSETSVMSSGESALERLNDFILSRRSTTKPRNNFEHFERELHGYVVAAEREALGEELLRWDMDVPVVEIDGKRYRRVLRSESGYLSAAGEVRVERSLYSRGLVGEPALCPLELRAGIVQGYWTPRAARQAIRTVAQMPAGEAQTHFEEMENMQPSRSSLDRLAKGLSDHWETNREAFELKLRARWEIPPQAVTVAVSLDGVMVPMRDGARDQKRAHSVVSGKEMRGPAGYQEVGCGTLSFYDDDGERLSTLRLGRMPESKKVTLKAMLSEELSTALERRPELRLVKVADGAKDNWSYLSKALPPGMEVVDFYHAASHLKTAFDQVYGASSSASTAQFEKYRHILRHDPEGIEKVIRTLAYHRQKYPRREKLLTELKYFRRNRHRMDFASVAEKNLPIGSGVVEAACKTLASARMKGAGMRWRHRGGQAILTWRALVQSGRFVQGWNLVAQVYKKSVTLPENVIAFPARAQAAK